MQGMSDVMAPQINKEEIKVRTKLMGEFGIDMPEEARALFDIAKNGAWPCLSFAVPALSPTVNHQYVQVARDRRVLSPETVTYRQMVAIALAGRRDNWKPRGPVMAMTFFLQPYWLTRKLTMRDADGDNRLKALFDAIQLATGVPDYTNWNIHAFKVTTTNRVATVVYMYDKGDIVSVFK